MPRSLLEERCIVPSFSLLDRDGQVFVSSRYKRQKNLVLFFLPHPSVEFLIRLEEVIPGFLKKNAEVVVISSLSVEEIGKIHRRHKITLWLLSDPQKEVFKKFIEAEEGESVAALFMTDKSGGLFFQDVAWQEVQLPRIEEILTSLNFIESQYSGLDGL